MIEDNGLIHEGIHSDVSEKRPLYTEEQYNRIRRHRNLLLNVILELAEAEGIRVSPLRDRSKLPLIWQKILNAVDEVQEK